MKLKVKYNRCVTKREVGERVGGRGGGGRGEQEEEEEEEKKARREKERMTDR